jgi:hypothetical protein
MWPHLHKPEPDIKIWYGETVIETIVDLNWWAESNKHMVPTARTSSQPTPVTHASKTSNALLL